MTRLLPLLVLLIAACGTPGGAPAGSDVPVRGVSSVGDAVCATCHESQSESFVTHGMANSFYRMTPEKVIENFNAPAVYHGPSNFFYRAYREGNRFFQEEYRVAEGGERTHELVREITHVVGSANAARTYVSQQADRYVELPLTWYAQKRVWDFSPGYRESNQRFDRKLTSRCMACHTDAPPRAPGTDDVFTREPLAISCERCHGPGQDHVNARRAVPEPPGDTDPTIINPARLDFDRRMDVCQQCHLNGAVVMYPDGRDPYSFRPGDALETHQTVFVAAHDPAGLEVVSHADRLKQSACFLETARSSKPLECTTCHDPHQGFRDSGPEYFNATCRGCHEQVAGLVPDQLEAEHAVGSNCISCHMVKKEADNAPHSSFTDHFIRASISDETRAAASDEPIRLQPLRGEATDATLARAYMNYGFSKGDLSSIERGVVLAERNLDQFLSPGNANAALTLGKALLLAGKPAQAVDPLRVALAADTTDAERLHGIARALDSSGDVDAADSFYAKAVALGPRSVAILSDYGNFLRRVGRLDESETMYRRAIHEDTSDSRAQNGLAAVLSSAGRYDEALAPAIEAVRLDPDYVDGLTNLGTLHARLGNIDESVRFLRHAVDLALPQGNLQPVLNLGLIELERGEYRASIDLIGHVVRANPNSPDMRLLLARAMVGKGDPISALAQVNAALRAVPGHEGALALKAQLEADN